MSTPSPASSTRGIHHITAIASDPARNVDFYSRVLGLRMIKKTVNFDDPGTYHLYYGDDPGSPGTIITFFPWPHVKRGDHGAGFLSATAYAIAPGSIEFWRDRLTALPRGVGVVIGGGGVGDLTTRFGARVLPFEDHDGMKLELIEDATSEPARAATRAPKASTDALGAGTLPPIPPEHAIRGFHSATLLERALDGTARFLSDLLGMRLIASEADGALTRHRFSTIHTDVATARHVDVVVNERAPMGKLGGGIVHHIAFRADGEAQQMAWHATLIAQNRNVSPQMDRNYFKSIYFREPGGVLFEVATDAPGFAIDETLESLGESLKIPPMYEHRRRVIESFLPKL